MQIEGRGALVTGASSGIGRAIARELARRGARLAILARRELQLEQLADEIAAAGGQRPTVLSVDLGEPGAARSGAQQALDALGHVDVLVNNAGLGLAGRQDVVGDAAAARHVFEVNVWSALALVQQLAPAMKATGGTIVNVTSTSQIMTWPVLGYYSATKAALASFTETLRLEMKQTPVHVIEVIPGPVDTAVQGETRQVAGLDTALAAMPLGDPDQLARRVVRAISRGRRHRLVYPRVNWIPYLHPGTTRTLVAMQVRRLRDQIDPNDPRVLRSGSMGDPIAVEARDAWLQRSSGSAAGP